MSTKKYDLVIFGASGFTGQFVVQYLAKQIADNGLTVSVAVAGRSLQKLDDVLAETVNIVGNNTVVKTFGKIIADVAKPDEMKSMAECSKIVLNCVGPYRYFGEQV